MIHCDRNPISKYTLSMTKESLFYFIINGCQRHWYSAASLNLNGNFNTQNTSNFKSCRELIPLSKKKNLDK